MDSFKIDDKGNILGAAFGIQAPSHQILSALEQRINAEVEPIAEKAMRDLERVVCGELQKMGIKRQYTSLTQFSASIKKQHAARLKDERINAIVDGLLSEKPVVMGVDIGEGQDKTGYFVSYPGPLTPLQRDEIRRILNPVPQPTPEQ